MNIVLQISGGRKGITIANDIGIIRPEKQEFIVSYRAELNDDLISFFKISSFIIVIIGGC